MYSFQPHPNLSVLSLVGNVATLMTCILLAVLVGYHLLKRKWPSKMIMICTPVMVASVIVIQVCSKHFNSNLPGNTRVVATLVSNKEVLVYEKVSKHRREHVPVMFVVYRTPDGDVSFRRYDGYVYPDSVYLYKK